ncbi:radical SAM protein [Candidatus Poribacteria bacterium]|nr:radical SAM protein [Candidatus Poribacteria bacterium]
MTESSAEYPRASSVYGPVQSWRFGRSLGIDLLLTDSICSFNCIYCQLGNIHQVIDEQKVFVPTARVLDDLAAVDWDTVDIVTFSGSGEPTLALNIGEVITAIRERYGKPTLVLTNSTWLHDAASRRRLAGASIIDCKLDAATDAMLHRFNRAAQGITLDRIITGNKAMKTEPGFAGKVSLQCMFMPINRDEVHALAALIRGIAPSEVQLNTPRRPYPREWYLNARGNHGGDSPVATVDLKTITLEEANEIEEILRRESGVPIRSVFNRPAQ